LRNGLIKTLTRSGLVSLTGDSVIDPLDQVAIGEIPNKQIQAVSHLVQMAVSQPMSWQRAGRDAARLGAGAARLLGAAVVKVPIGLQLGAGRPLGETGLDRGPGGLTMFGHVVCGDLIRDPLEAEVIDQPVIQGLGM
jgi:hypothetical protein